MRRCPAAWTLFPSQTLQLVVTATPIAGPLATRYCAVVLLFMDVPMALSHPLVCKRGITQAQAKKPLTSPRGMSSFAWVFYTLIATITSHTKSQGKLGDNCVYVQDSEDMRWLFQQVSEFFIFHHIFFLSLFACEETLF